jgi:dGTPase
VSQPPIIRHLAEQREDSLSPHAQRSRLSRGRLLYEQPCPIRTEFQRDRDRILYSKAFRRLKHKTQVFIAPLGDHYVTRLTHTLEVSQVARTIARALNLNEDLAEAISLGHDLGHTPFGHVGEDALDEVCPDGFRHNEQSLRIADRLERDGKGLNLTWEVRDGILNHSKPKADVLGRDWGEANTLEGEVCRLADLLAYVNHDAEDAIRAGVLSEGSLPIAVVTALGMSHSERINAMVTDVIRHSWPATGAAQDSGETVVKIRMSDRVLEATNALREFLFEHVYDVRSAQTESDRAREVVRHLYRYFSLHPEQLPPEHRLRKDKRWQRVADYIAGMTDRYAMRVAEEVGLLDGHVQQQRLFPDRI